MRQGAPVASEGSSRISAWNCLSVVQTCMSMEIQYLARLVALRFREAQIDKCLALLNLESEPCTSILEALPECRSLALCLYGQTRAVGLRTTL